VTITPGRASCTCRPCASNKYLDTLVHTAISTGHLATRLRPDVAMYFIAGNAPVVPFARLAGIPSILQIDGMDSQRAKWPAAAKAYLRAAERFSPLAATVAVTDSQAVADDFFLRYHRRIDAIPYGAELPDPGGTDTCDRLGVEPGRFILFVGRLVPENNAHLLIRAHRLLGRPDWPLVVVGDAPYANRYITDLKHEASPDVRMPGYVFGNGYAELVHRCGIMCAPTEVGGTHPVITEALAAGACVVTSDHGPNLEVVGDAAATFNLAEGEHDLARVLETLLDHPERREELAARAAARAAERFSWDACAERYLEIAERIRRG